MRVFLVFLLISFSGIAYGQSDADSAGVAAAFIKLERIARTMNRAPAAGYICYRGKDKSREWKSPANYANSDERRGVDDVCARIYRLTPDGYRILSFETETESEGTWLVLKVRCVAEKIVADYYFAFLKAEGAYLLGDIDPAR